MKELVKKYQEEGNREVIEKILGLVEMDLKRMLDEGYIPESELFYVAYRIRAMLMNRTLGELNYSIRQDSKQRNKYKEIEELVGLLFEADRYSLEAEEEIGVKIGIGEFIVNDEIGFGAGLRDLEYFEDDFNYEEIYYNKNYDSIYRNIDKLQNLLPEWRVLLKLLDEFSWVDKNSEEARAIFHDVKQRFLPPLVEGLEEALSKVDTERSPREMITYINRVMLNKYNKAVELIDGTKRIYHHKDKKNYFIKPKYEIDPWKLILGGKTLKHRGLESFEIHLTEAQRELLLDTYQVIELELQKENSQAFRWKKNGEPVMQKRFVAKKLGLNENSFKQRLKRATDKIIANW